MNRTRLVALLVAPGLVLACTGEHAPATTVAATPASVPEYLERLEKSGEVHLRKGRDYENAPAGDNAILRGYPKWTDKGPLTGPAGERLTIMTAKKVYAAGEEIRVVHVHEATKPGVSLFVMGPKSIYGEYVDGKLASPAASAPPEAYDGRVLESPGEDHNYDVSVHRLAPGVHTIQWRFATLSGPTVLASNVLTVEVR